MTCVEEKSALDKIEQAWMTLLKIIAREFKDIAKKEKRGKKNRIELNSTGRESRGVLVH